MHVGVTSEVLPHGGSTKMMIGSLGENGGLELLYYFLMVFEVASQVLRSVQENV